MKLLFYTSLLLFVSLSTSCDDDGVSSYSDCKNKGSDCCFVYFEFDVPVPENEHSQRCVDSSSVSNIVSNMEKDIKRKGGTIKTTIQCSSNPSNYLMLDLLALIILFYISVY